MTIPFWCLFAAIFLPYILAVTASVLKVRQFGRLDNNNPRAQSAALEGPGARAWAAQQNAWEALLVFAISVFVAHLAGADPRNSAIACVVFIGARVLHAVCYIADLATARSAMFSVATLSCLWLFWLAATV